MSSNSSWDEIKSLARDLQRVQLSATTQKLSERNCIEIVQRLCELSLLDVIYTTDGKQYITPAELGKEIREELTVQDGRVDLVELQQTLSVDLSHIETKVCELVRSDKTLINILGQLIDKNYLDRLSEEINDKLQEQGRVTVAELAKTYNLPGELIQETVETRLGRSIKAVKHENDRSVFYTESFVARHRAKIYGAFSAVTRPTPVHGVMARHDLLEHLFFSILDSLISEGRLAGVVSGGHQDKAVYVPTCYTRAQNNWVDSFYKQNGYLEYDALSRLKITEPHVFVKKRYAESGLIQLKSCCVGALVRDRLEAEVEEAVSGSTWTDVVPVLPTVCSPSDAHELLESVVKSSQLLSSSVVICCQTVVCSKQLVNTLQQSFQQLIRVKAEKTVRDNPSILLSHMGGDKGRQTMKTSDKNSIQSSSSHKEDKGEGSRRKTGGGGGSKGGSGMSGREVKTKSTKKKTSYGKDSSRGAGDDSDDEHEPSQRGREGEQEFMSIEELEAELTKNAALKDAPSELITAIAEIISRPLNREYSEQLKSVFLQTVLDRQTVVASTEAAPSGAEPESGSGAMRARRRTSQTTWRGSTSCGSVLNFLKGGCKYLMKSYR